MLRALPLRQSLAKSPFYEGIDFLRAGAVFLVLWSHGGHLVSGSWKSFLFSDLFRPGFWGVTIFFAISGFLIVGQLLDISSGIRKETLKVFVLRRWLRVVPTYWLVLVFYLFAGIAPWPDSSDLVANLLFLQGWLIEGRVLIPVSWSLVIEFWSYLFFAFLFLLPFLLHRLVLPTLGRPRQGDGRWLILAVLVGLPTVACLLRWQLLWDAASIRELKQGLFSQCDALAYGGLLAWISRFFPKAFEILSFAPLQAIVALLVLMTSVTALTPAMFMNVLDPASLSIRPWIAYGYYPLTGALSALLIAGMWRFRYAGIPDFIAIGCRWLSRCSYSVYLLHLPVAGWLNVLNHYLAFPLYILASILFGFLGWRFLEKPFAKLRHAL